MRRDAKPDAIRPQSIPPVGLFEVASLLVSVLITIWGIVPLLPFNRGLMAIPLLLALTLTVSSHILRRETLEEIGLTGRYFGQAVRLLALPTVLGGGVLILVAHVCETAPRPASWPQSLLNGLVPFLLSGIAQQYLLQGFIHRRLRSVFAPPGEVRAFRRPEATTILLTAICFSVIHIPNPALTILTFIGGLAWSVAYQRAPNIYAAGLSHGLMSLMIVKVAPPWMVHSLSVGYKHFLYQYYR